jgi:hypothetical protein
MARGENQGLQIALIIFVIVALILGVSTFYFFQKYDEERQKAAQAQTETATKVEDARKAAAERDRLMAIVGFGPATPLEKVDADTKKDFETYAPGLEPGKQDYRSALALQQAVILQKHEDAAAEKIKVASLEKNNEEREKIKQPQLDQLKEGQRSEQAKAKEDAAKHLASVTTLSAEKDKIAAEWNQKQNEFGEGLKTARTDLQKATQELAKARNEVKAGGEVITRFNARTSTVPDGQIVWVDQRTRMAWINLGQEDALPRQQTFSVHPADTLVMSDEGEAATRKASIEVVKVTGAHMAEVKILDYNLSNPVMAGDKIFTPVWHPGRRQHFAIAGITDINGDGSDDRQQVKDIIALSGGVVDLELTSSGNKLGPGITYDTNYLIRGAIPKSVDAGDENAPKVAKAMSEMENDAKNHGARVISLEQFLDDIGYTNRERIFRQGSGEEYTLKQGVRAAGGRGVSRGSTSELFRKREPTGGTAYGKQPEKKEEGPKKKPEKKAEEKAPEKAE